MGDFLLMFDSLGKIKISFYIPPQKVDFLLAIAVCDRIRKKEPCERNFNAATRLIASLDC